MKQVRSAEAKAQAKAAREARKAEEDRAAEELHSRRTNQLQDTRLAIAKLEENLRIIRKKATGHTSLTSHLEGFYEEIDKLAKGKAMLEVTPLVLDQTNDVIRDAKAIAKGDVYLDRVREFVPAGNNPVYPDVLVVLRILRQGLERWGAELEDRTASIHAQLKKAETVASALEYHLDEGGTPTKEELERKRGGLAVDDSCFLLDDVTDVSYFDFDRNDREQQDRYVIENGEGGDQEG